MSNEYEWNDFLNPVQDVLTSEWQNYTDLAAKVNAKIASGEMNAGENDCCSYSWFDELWQASRAERKVEPIMVNNVQKGGRIYFRLPQ